MVASWRAASSVACLMFKANTIDPQQRRKKELKVSVQGQETCPGDVFFSFQTADVGSAACGLSSVRIMWLVWPPGITERWEVSAA